MNIDKLLINVDKKIKEVDSIAKKKNEEDKLRAELDLLHEAKKEVESQFESLVSDLYMRKNESLKCKLREICDQKGIEYNQKDNGILSLSYRDYLTFTVNLSSNTRYISRSEGRNKVLGFRVEYSLDYEDFSFEHTTENLPAALKLNELIESKREEITYYRNLVLRVNNLALSTKITLDDGEVHHVESEEDIIEKMFG
ncbi:hypothetical protein [Photobacterium leiognathi]|uniref:hypothetical protein n=1 Tax=Photobacterium leiognathi TaxID=553611 RepID=UPI002738E70A|nr:hypothetical protein [Photobacterium leiognathi]